MNLRNKYEYSAHLSDQLLALILKVPRHRIEQRIDLLNLLIKNAKKVVNQSNHKIVSK